MFKKAIQNAVKAAMREIFGRKSNGFISSKDAARLEDRSKGIPEDRREAVATHMAVSLVRGHPITEREALAELQDEWKAANEASEKKHNAQEAEAMAFLDKYGLKVQEFDWGCIYSGKRESLIRAGLAKPEHFKPKKQSKKGEEVTYWLPLNWKEQYDERCYSGKYSTSDPIPRRWDAELKAGALHILGDARDAQKGGYSVNVYKEEPDRDDRGIRARAQEALAELSKSVPNMDLARLLVREIPTLPAYVELPQAIKAAEAFDKSFDKAQAKGKKK